MGDLEKEPAGELVRRAVGQLKDLMTVEVELAKREAGRQARQLVAGAVGFAVAAGLVSAAFAMGLVALFLALGPSVAAAGAIAAALLFVAIVVALVASRLLPKKPMGRTAARVEHEIEDVKEAIAS